MKNKNLTFNEKQIIYKKMVDIADYISKKDTENKIFLRKIFESVTVGICVVGTLLIGMMMAGSSGDEGGSDVGSDDNW